MLIVVAAALLYGAAAGSTYNQSRPPDLGLAYWLTWAFFYIDVMVVVAFAVLVMTLSSTPNFALIMALLFYVIGHAVAAVHEAISLLPPANGLQADIVLPLLSWLRYTVPDLSLLDLRDWSLYAQPIDGHRIMQAVVAAIAYIGFLLSVAVLVFQRREFA